MLPKTPRQFYKLGTTEIGKHWAPGTAEDVTRLMKSAAFRKAIRSLPDDTTVREANILRRIAAKLGMGKELETALKELADRQNFPSQK